METTVASFVGNLNLVSNEEDILAEYLKKHNLEQTNTMSAKVDAKKSIYTKYVKRVLDLLVAVPAFIVTLPFNILFGICTFLDVGRPIFYKQTRVGLNGKPFVIVKFRNMNNNTDADGRLLTPKERVTKFGKIMRKLSMDELLNFWSVIKGDMSIIGPRPLPVVFSERMSERHKQRVLVRPGLECPRVLKGDPEQCQYQTQFENDVWYVENVSFMTDVRMVFSLVKMVFNLSRREKSAEGAGYFAGYDHHGVATTINRFKRMYPDIWKQIRDERI